MALLVGIDVGTGGVKTIAVDESGQICARSFREYPSVSPSLVGLSKIPRTGWQATLETLQDVAGQLGSRASEIKGIGLSGQMQSSVFLDGNRQVIRPAILWNDGRTARQCRWITQEVGQAQLISHTANKALEGFTAPKVIWLREEEPENYARVRWLMLPKDYVRMRLTGEIYTEVSDAAGTLLFDVANRRWSEAVLSRLNIDPNILPEVKESGDCCGYLTQEVAAPHRPTRGHRRARRKADNACGAVGAGIVKNRKSSL